MANLNKVFLMGNLTRDPALTYTQGNKPLCAFGMASNRSWTGQDGQKHEEATFVDLTAWGKSAETIAKYLHKGDPLFIEGRLKLDQWEDKQSGQKRSKLTVTVDSFQFVGGKKSDAGDSATPGGQHSAPAASDAGGPVVDDGGIPF